MKRKGLQLLLLALPALLLFATGTQASPSGDMAEPIRLAITLDDLPWVGALPAEGTATEAVLRMAAVLRAHEAPATGFVICDNARTNSSPVETWVAWGFTVGNHTAAHRDLDTTPLDEWLDGVERCHEYLERYDDAYLPYLRFPLLHEGSTAAKRDAARDGVRAIGLGTAHVTVDTSEWLLAQAHARAIQDGNAKLRREIGESFIRHIIDAIEHADAVARRKTERRIPQVLLLHANSLVEDYLDELLLALRSRNIEFITLPDALSDPVFSREDAYAGGKGLSWLYRMAPATPHDVAWDDAQANMLRERFPATPEARDVRSGISSARIDPSLGEDFRRVLEHAGESERLRSVLIAHHGKLVAEAYFNGAGPAYAANLKSVTKTLTAALVGVALDRNWIANLDATVGDYLPIVAKNHPGKAGITIRELLTMSSGMQAVDYGVLQQSENWLETILDAPLVKGQRGTFAYDTPVLQLLAAILRAASEKDSVRIANEYLLQPLDTELGYWRAGPQGIAFAGNDAYLSPAGMLRFGQLFLDGGKFNGRQLLSREYVDAATRVQLPTGSDWINHGTFRVKGYGYLWWLIELDGRPVQAALGHGGQMILVSPQQALVVVVTSRWPGPSSVEHYKHVTRMLEEDIFPLFESTASSSSPETN